MVQLRKGKGQRILRVGVGVRIDTAGDRTVPEPANRGNDVIGVQRRLPAALSDGFLDHFHRVFGQQLQDPHVLPRAGRESLALFEVGS